MANVESITFEAGSFVVRTDVGPAVRYPIADMLRAADIPVLTITQLTLLTTFANLFEILFKDLVARDVIDDALYADYDLEHFFETLTDTFKTDIGD